LKYYLLKKRTSYAKPTTGFVPARENYGFATGAFL
jgi:hypothetical protein